MCFDAFILPRMDNPRVPACRRAERIAANGGYEAYVEMIAADLAGLGLPRRGVQAE
jgi:hypothetical protein